MQLEKNKFKNTNKIKSDIMRKILKIAGFSLLGILVIWTFVALWKKSQPVEKEFQIESVTKRNIERRTVVTGVVQPRNEILIKPQMSGIISEVYKEAGEQIKAGDIIAKIQVVPDMFNLSSAESRVSRAQLATDQSRAVFERDKKLFENNVISKEEFERSELQHKNNEEELKTASDNLSLVKTGMTKSSEKTSNTLVKSTVSGTILDIPIKVGNSVIESNNFNDGTTIATIANLNDMLFEGKIDETEVGKLHNEMPMEITIGAIQDKKINAVLEYVSPKGNNEGGAILFKIKAAISMTDDIYIRAGYSANAEIILNKRDSVMALPENCVEFRNDSAFVHKQTEENQEFNKVFVKTGLSDGIFIEITDGLQIDDKIRGNEVIKSKK